MLLFNLKPVTALGAVGTRDVSESKNLEVGTRHSMDSWVYMLVLAPVTIAFIGIYIRSVALKKIDKNK